MAIGGDTQNVNSAMIDDEVVEDAETVNFNNGHGHRPADAVSLDDSRSSPSMMTTKLEPLQIVEQSWSQRRRRAG